MTDHPSDVKLAPVLTPLVDLTFLLLVFLMLLPMRGLDRKVAAFLPADR